MSEEEDKGVAVVEAAARPKLDKAAGKKVHHHKKAAKKGRFAKSLPLIASDIGLKDRMDSETLLALGRCLDVLADGMARACADFAKPIPDNDAGYEPQMLTGVLAFNAIFARIPLVYEPACSTAVHRTLDLFCGVDSRHP